ncbi:MAG TPA: aminotransferase class V-fold PLP-dependent enzyme, partial [Gammaproteobacteria bacterium]|nr:aminotransferase class V-fold PLP-dependent enzyme [Gammaproteobacteria bacterium]
GLDWDDGDSVVITDQEFPSNRIVWESLRPLGVTVRQAPLNEGPSPEDAILERVGERTRLISVSSVQFGSGLRLDLERLGRYCRQHQILFCVDAIQSLGAVPMDVSRIHADFVMADGHKWMLGPEGLAVFYCRTGVRERLTLHQYGWHMVEQMGEFDRPDWQVARSGRRFECGSPNMLGIHALNASLQLLEEVGSEAIFTQILRNTSYIIDKLNSISRKYEILTPTDPARHAGIVTFRPRKTDPEALFQHLRAGGVLCARRGGGIRFSPHFYTPPTVLDRALALL